MLDNIKSLYILKDCFSVLDEKRKLLLIKFNRRIQNKININLIHYKLFSGKYIIYEENGIMKEFNGYDNIMLYEGGYLNGKRNGKGKEYDKKGVLIYEGNYLNCKRNGKGREYYNYYFNDTLFSKIIFEGEYLNGEKWNGKEREYDTKGFLIY